MLALGLPLVAVHGVLLLLGDLARHLEAALALWAAAFLALAWAARRLERAGGAAPFRALAGGVLGVAVALRLLLLPLPPTLSNDVHRYLWDGRVAAAGHDPYRLAPAAAELAPLRDDGWEMLDHQEVPTVYPPLALAAFAAASRSPAPVLAWKGLLTAADLAACCWLLALARRRGLPPGRAVLYAWNPLVVLEVAGMGHVDALGVAAAVGAVLALSARRPRLAGLGAALGILAKLAPLVALPAWARAAGAGDRGGGRPWAFLAVALGVTGLAAVPVLVAAGGIPPGLVTYGVSWEFNGPLFEPLWRLLAAVGAESRLAAGVDAAKSWSGHHEAWNRIYPYLYPQLLAKVVLAAGMLTAVALSLRPGEAVTATRRLFGRLLLLSATVYPWYLLWVLPWAALERRIPWLALSATLLLTYLPQVRAVPLMPWIFLAVWLPPLALALGRRASPCR